MTTPPPLTSLCDAHGALLTDTGCIWGCPPNAYTLGQRASVYHRRQALRLVR